MLDLISPKSEVADSNESNLPFIVVSASLNAASILAISELVWALAEFIASFLAVSI